MRHPFRTEEEAFRFVWLTIGCAALIVVATAAVLAWWLRARREEEPLRTAPRPHAENERRILVIANETVGGETLREMILRKAEGADEQVRVVVPALNSPLRHWASDEDAARAAAADRLEASLRRLKEAGVDADGEVGDGDPLQAIEDALRTFGADEIVISTHPEGRSNWLERGVVEKARDRFDCPITHVVVDLQRES